jgi:ribosomal peptide maturation radical SAM protein 1
MQSGARDSRAAYRNSVCEGSEQADVLFASMPYVSIERPSVALGTLAAALHGAGISCRTEYGNLTFAERIGIIPYQWINNSDITLQIGEWTFSEVAFRQPIRGVEDYVARLVAEGLPQENLRETLLGVREVARGFIDDMAERIVASGPRIVGCSSVFQQHCASLALLRRVRELDPSIITMLGGANCESSMGAITHQQYPWVDFVVSGEADKLLPELCALLFEHGVHIAPHLLPYGVLGPSTRGTAQNPIANPPRAIIDDLDEIPVPYFDDYFEQLERSALRDWVLPCLPIETSRGCWWGAKHHCTFCGLNGAGMTFRAKSQERVEHEVTWLSERHGLTKFMTVDNILDNRYFGKVLPSMAERGDLRVFYETKANLSRTQVELLSRAGVRWIQPGIEALHDDLLTLLKKGTTVPVNVQLLKWARRYGVWVVWNHLYAAPGDDPAWYDAIADWIPLIWHLQPPAGGGMNRIRYDRFSPYFNTPDTFGLKLTPYWAYAHAYPLDEQGLREQAYFFCHDGENPPAPLRLIGLINRWAELFYGSPESSVALPRRSEDAPVLAMQDAGTRIRIRDTRPCAIVEHHLLDPLESRICRATDTAKGDRAVAAAVRTAGASEPDSAIDAALERLVAAKLIANFDGRYLCLAVDDDPVPYLSFEEFAGGLALLGGPRRPKRSNQHDPWDMPIREMF